jgi:hypothetical protein
VVSQNKFLHKNSLYTCKYEEIGSGVTEGHLYLIQGVIRTYDLYFHRYDLYLRVIRDYNQNIIYVKHNHISNIRNVDMSIKML